MFRISFAQWQYFSQGFCIPARSLLFFLGPVLWSWTFFLPEDCAVHCDVSSSNSCNSEWRFELPSVCPADVKLLKGALHQCSAAFGGHVWERALKKKLKQQRLKYSEFYFLVLLNPNVRTSPLFEDSFTGRLWVPGAVQTHNSSSPHRASHRLPESLLGVQISLL